LNLKNNGYGEIIEVLLISLTFLFLSFFFVLGQMLSRKYTLTYLIFAGFFLGIFLDGWFESDAPSSN